MADYRFKDLFFDGLYIALVSVQNDSMCPHKQLLLTQRGFRDANFAAVIFLYI